MRRRHLLRAMGASATLGVAGCIGGGSKIVTNVQRDVSVTPGTGWVQKIPDVSEHGGAIQYSVRAKKPFDVYFFVGESQYLAYDDFTDGTEPPETPFGDASVGTSAEEESNTYVASTTEDGAREPIEGTGPYYFVVDHSAYLGRTPPKEHGGPLKAFVDLTVTKKRFL
ncbi:hypothetical protein VB773_05425 [Haloarculaceae archaeon H-GB2-1]|nr:hypothetical protein [Haloarculaceae archaeon H-GB1-1]MEA5389014.1 hypothetical protein [Haloarculaceae archaeon H-GB11]MEA5407073.1 hypothetical protein [Haloarculaceae archaeon H-GB2-1]